MATAVSAQIHNQIFYFIQCMQYIISKRMEAPFRNTKFYTGTMSAARVYVTACIMPIAHIREGTIYETNRTIEPPKMP